MTDEFVHIRIVLGIILGLSLTHLIKGSISFIQHPGSKKIYIIHILWVVYVFITIIHFWWREFALKNITEWEFFDYLYIICYFVLYYSICAILYPEDLKDFKDYKAYFYSRKNWFFGALSLCYLADFLDIVVKGTDYFYVDSSMHKIRLFSHLFLCLLAIKFKNPKYHLFMVIGFISFELWFIFKYYFVEI